MGRRNGRLTVVNEKVSRKSQALDFAESTARMTMEGECTSCGWRDEEDPAQDGGDCPECGGSLFKMASEDAITTVNGLIAGARELTGHSPRKDRQ